MFIGHPILSLALMMVAPADGEVDSLRTALNASEPNPDRVRGLLDAVVQSADPKALSVFTEQALREVENAESVSEITEIFEVDPQLDNPPAKATAKAPAAKRKAPASTETNKKAKAKTRAQST